MPGIETTKDRLARDRHAVDASPTKSFFVSIITRDIQLDRAIADLVDNCVDGAKRLRPGNASRYDGLFVNIIVNDKEFSIHDNCGGIERDIARYYAFKFGRDEDFVDTSYSVGQFGVGMKRALFKMGRNFEVQTRNVADTYRVNVDVNKWLKTPDIWDFRLEDGLPDDTLIDEPGTVVKAWNLYDGVSQIFTLEYFIRRLKDEIKTTQQSFMQRGLAISLNNEAIISDDWQLIASEGIEPYFARFQDDFGGNAPVSTRLYAGVGPSAQSKAGWYIFCNGRCLVEADQSTKTGWGEIDGESGVRIPRYHNQFSRFRGFAYLDCEDASRLPWNTTKTDIDLEAPAYRKLYGRLVDAARPVIDFLNDLDREADYDEADKALSRIVKRTAPTPLSKISERATFTYRPPAIRGPVLKTISFKKPADRIDELQSAMNASSAKDVGDRSFEFAYERYVEENDL